MGEPGYPDHGHAWLGGVVSEEWRDVPEYEGLYQVSNIGRLKSLARVIVRSNGATMSIPERLMTGSVHPHGYLRARLRTSDSSRDFYIHRLVAEAFIGPCPEGQMVCHWDGVPTNNHVENLRYGTTSDNNLDAVRHGTHHNASKTHCVRNHPLEGENLGTQKSGRLCLACERERNAKRYV